MICAIISFQACKKDNIKKEKKKSDIIGYCILCTNNSCSDSKKTANCGDALSFVQNDNTLGGQYIYIQGSFPDKSGIVLSLSWDGNPEKATFTLNSDDLGTNNSGTAHYFLQVGALPSYQTAEGGTGSATITSYDEINKLVSGTFKFRGKYFDGANFTNNYKDISGSFSDVSIIDPNNPQFPCSGNGGNGGGGGATTSSVTYKNQTFSNVNITLAGSQKTIAPGNSVSFTGNANTGFTAAASTSGKTSEGGQVGLQIQWKLDGNFPASGTSTTLLNVPSKYFFLKLINKSGKTINKLYTNYKLVSQTAENLSIPGDNREYSLGYYEAYTNSNIRAESANTFWSWSNLNLPFTINQSLTVTATP